VAIGQLERRLQGAARRAPAAPSQRMGLGMWAWLLQRLSGLLLVVSVGLHFVSKAVMPFPRPLVLANDSLLILLTVYHGFNGVRVVLIDLGPGIRAQRAIFWGCVAAGAAVAAWMLAAYLGPRL
jgi:succinate dehydrogenase / fumarate reductase cytochrome b subunit